MTIKSTLRRVSPKAAVYVYRFLKFREDRRSIRAFLSSSASNLTTGQKLKLIHRMYEISAVLKAPHTQAEMLAFMGEILSLPNDSGRVVVEAGCFKGASTAKFSLAAQLAGKKLVVFDSFEGIPEHEEDHRNNIFGEPVRFAKGSYCGRLDEVRANVARFGNIDCCEFRKGWFRQTMPVFDQPVATAYLDVDLVDSTRTCLRYLYPLLRPGGAIYSQDGHLPLVVDALRDQSFWRDELGVDPPVIEGLGERKLVRLVKPAAQSADLEAKDDARRRQAMPEA